MTTFPPIISFESRKHLVRRAGILGPQFTEKEPEVQGGEELAESRVPTMEEAGFTSGASASGARPCVSPQPAGDSLPQREEREALLHRKPVEKTSRKE